MTVDASRDRSGDSHLDPPEEVVIGVDVGTTATKVVAFGIGTAWRARALREYPLLEPEPGHKVQDPQTIIAAVTATLKQCVSALEGAQVVALSVSSGMHGLIGLDKAARPLTPLVTWADARSHQEAKRLRNSAMGPQLHRTSGTPVHPMSPLTKLMWFAHHEPELCARVRWWAGLKDYVLEALTGTVATELSSASGTGLLDVHTGTWNPVALDLADVSPDRLPPILATTATLELSKEMAAQVGLPTSTPVVTGAGDGPLGNLGTGAMEPGIAGLSLGTSGAVRMVRSEPAVDPQGRLFCYALTDTQWVLGGAVSNGGMIVRWAGELFGRDLVTTPDEPVPDDKLLALAAGVPPGSDGLVMLPYLLAERAPLWDPDLRGAFLGLQHAHTRGHFVRAAVEGVALQLSTIVEQLDRIEPVTTIRATGGVFRSDLWRQIMVAVLGRPLQVIAGAEGSARGAAALGLVGCGRAATPTAALARLPTPITGTETPSLRASPDETAVYDRLRASIPELLGGYGAVSSLFAQPANP